MTECKGEIKLRTMKIHLITIFDIDQENHSELSFDDDSTYSKQYLFCGPLYNASKSLFVMQAIIQCITGPNLESPTFAEKQVREEGKTQVLVVIAKNYYNSNRILQSIT
ncbi:hypothetical protein ACTXT7_015894 [Hymenolepis weldensis]